MGKQRNMGAEALSELLQAIHDASLEIWLDGGWGVDALLAKQTRKHEDVDIVIRISDIPRLMDVLSTRGFSVKEGQVPDSFVMANDQGLQVDVHSVVFDEEGNGVYRMQNGQDWIYPAEGFRGKGMIGDLSVKCLSPETQVLCHAHGYEPGETDFHDMEMLRDVFDVTLPQHLKRPKGSS
jgi:lincosamide nucleotidyltransferase A/C/D/E